jgi:hypothetical protein
MVTINFTPLYDKKKIQNHLLFKVSCVGKITLTIRVNLASRK